jgi:hypothetical protein
MAKELTFAELAKRVGGLPVTLMATAEAPTVSVRAPSNQAMSVARALVGALPAADERVMRVAAKLQRLVSLTQLESGSKRMRSEVVSAAQNG